MIRPPFDQLLFVGTGGFLGANARYILSAWITAQAQRVTGYHLPIGTVFVNVIGSFLLAVFSVWVARHIHWSENTRLLVATGFFGAFTTFSTYANESITLIRSGDRLLGFGNIIATNLLCLAGVLIGLWVASRMSIG